MKYLSSHNAALGGWQGIARRGLSGGWVQMCPKNLKSVSSTLDSFELDLPLEKTVAAVVDEQAKLVRNQVRYFWRGQSCPSQTD